MVEGKPTVWFATEIPWFWMVTLPSVTVSVYCSPEKRPEPYVTDYICQINDFQCHSCGE